MRLLVVMNLYPPHAWGGYEDLCHGAVTRWREAGHHVEVLTSTVRRDDVDDDPDEQGVRRALPIAWRDHGPHVPAWRTLRRWQGWARERIRAAVRDVQPEVVSIWNPGALPFGMLREVVDLDVPVALVVLDRWLTWGPESDPWLQWASEHPRLARLVATATGLPTSVPRLGAHVTALFASEFLRRDAAAHGAWPLDDTAVVPHGVDLGRYPLADPDAPARPWRGRLLYVGRITAEKGVTTAVRAVAELPHTTLDVVGTGRDTERRWIHDLAAELGITDRVHLRGEAAPDTVRAAHDDADVLVFPSRWAEPFGIVPLEAMARGVPVVASGTGGSGEFCVDQRTCLRFPADDHLALARAVRRLRDEADLRDRVRRGGLQTAAHLARDTADAHLLAWHLHLAGHGPRPGDRPLLPPGLARGDA